MNLTGNTIFITGGGSGIGAGLATALHNLGNTVILGGRREEMLRAICDKHPGMTYQVLDVANIQSIEKAVAELKARQPTLNCLVNNAGIQRHIDFNEEKQVLSSLTEEIDINLKGLILITSALLPLLKRNANATIVNVSSGLGFIPQSRTPVYSATKAAVHSLSLSLRQQLSRSGIAVIEVIPPAVRTDLDQGERRNAGPKPMEVAEFVEQTIKALSTKRQEIVIGQAGMLRIGSRLAPSRFFSLVNG